jgi:hypothetical protein
MPWDYDKPFLSETGYRSFIGIFAPHESGVTPEDFAKGVIRGHLKREHKGTRLPGARLARRRCRQWVTIVLKSNDSDNRRGWTGY